MLADDASAPHHDILLHAIVDFNMVSPSVFEDLGDHIAYRSGDRRLDDALLDLWDAQESDKRWSEVEYLVRGNSFEVSFAYPEEIDSDEDSLDRRDRIIERYFGKKPVEYPLPPDDVMEYRH
ncbi:MAG TPA: hypothetical protein VI168_04480 [Croceibacterium sp.]